MLSKKKTKELIGYWITNSKEKYKTMESLYADKRYFDCLYFGHMILEMALKALVVLKTEEYAPKIHNLKYLAELAKLQLSEKDWEFLGEVNNFNMEARYPNEKLEFYKLCNKSYTDHYYDQIISLYKKLCRQTKLKK